MKCKICNQPVLYFGCEWIRSKKIEKIYFYCFDCGLQVLKMKTHNVISKCYTMQDIIRGKQIVRDRKVEFLRSEDFGDSIRHLKREVIVKYAWVIAKVEDSNNYPPEMYKINRVLQCWGMKPLAIEDIHPNTQLGCSYFSHAIYFDKVRRFVGKNFGIDDPNEIDWFSDAEGEAKWNKQQEEEAARKRYFQSLIVPKEYRERWDKDRERLMKELEEKRNARGIGCSLKSVLRGDNRTSRKKKRKKI